MKKLAFFLALFVGLNTGGIARKPEEDDNQVIVVKFNPRYSRTSIIWMIASKLKACYYGVTRDGLIQEIKIDLIQKLKLPLTTETNNIHNKNLPIENKTQKIWLLMNYQFNDDNEKTDYQIFVNCSAK